MSYFCLSQLRFASASIILPHVPFLSAPRPSLDIAIVENNCSDDATVSNGYGRQVDVLPDALNLQLLAVLGWLGQPPMLAAAGFLAATLATHAASPRRGDSREAAAAASPRDHRPFSRARSDGPTVGVVVRLAVTASLALMPSPTLAALGASDLAAMRAISTAW